MFDSILSQSRPLRRIGRGALASIVVHAVVISLVVYISIRLGKKSARKAATNVTFVQARPAPPPPPPPPPPPARAARRAVRKVPKVVTAPDPEAIVKPKEKERDKPAAKEEPEEADDGGREGGVPGGVKGGVAGGVLGGKLGGKLGAPPPPKAAVLPFGAGMTRPQRIGGRDPSYTREALAARVEGLMIVRCTITVDGKLQDCRVLKSLPHMEKAVLEALATHRYKPVTFQGKPVSVQYVFNIKLVMP